MAIISKNYFETFFNRYQAKLDTAIKEYVGDKADPANEMFFESGTAIPENADLNDYTNLGKFYSSNRARTLTISNRPSSLGGFTLFVIKHTPTYVIQIVQINDSDKVRYYTREITLAQGGNTYGAWVRGVSSEIPANGVVTYQGYFAGHITSSGKGMSIAIPYSESSLDGYTVSLTSTSLVVRGVNGYVQDSITTPLDLSTATAIHIHKRKTELCIYVEYSEAFTNITNNTPICADGSVTIQATLETE